MLPEKLVIQAFGPYVEKQEIDFSDISSHHLFLIQGETGSGKTMLLDAITFALFGKSSGGQRESMEAMRSRFASDDIHTFVEFIFSLKGKRYRFVRKVEVKTKRNKEKVWKSSVDAGEIVNGEFLPFFENPKLKNVEEKAEELIGLRYEQFVQVMVLPQGKFEQFLTSKSEEKQEILKTLFQMEHWENINAWLVEYIKQEKQKLDDLQGKQQIYLETLKEESIEQAKATMDSLKTELEEKKKELIKQNKKVACLEKELVEQKQRNEDEQAFETCRKELDTLQEKQGAINAQKEKLAHYKKLQGIFPYYHAYDTAAKQYEKRMQQSQLAYEKLKKIQEESSLEKERKQQVESLQKHEEICRKTYQSLQEDMVLLKEIEILNKTWEEHQKQQKEILEKEENVSRRLEDTLRKKDAMQKDIQILKQELQSKEDIDNRHRKLEQAKILDEEKQSINIALEKEIQNQQMQEEKRKSYELEVETADAKHEKVYQQYLQTAALQLSKDLEEGKPCPVCGSLHHPSYAHVSHMYVDLQELKTYKEKLEQAKEQYQKQKDLLKEINLSIQTKKQRCIQIDKEILQLLEKPFTKEEFETTQNNLQIMQKKEKQWQNLLVDEQNIQNEIQRLYVLKSEYQNKSITYKEENSAYSATLKQKTSQLHSQDSMEVIKKHYQQTEQKQKQYEKEIEMLQKQIEEVKLQEAAVKENYAHAQEEEKKAKEEKKQAEDRFVKQCFTYGVEKEEIVEIPEENILLKMEESIQSYEQNVVEVSARKEMLEARLQKMESKDVPALEEESEQARNGLKQLQEDTAKQRSQWELYRATLKKAEDTQRLIEVQMPKFLKKQHFVKAMRGDNGVGIERYVLGVLLQTILQYANQLLRQVHDGRYQLYRSDEAIGRVRKSGLELGIYDSYSMGQRSVVSLSGGEKFLVSLALSLATSFVVQSKNGGMQLDAMFIDEGFGTLDEHSIADALHILQTMTKRKGMVGIISHVEILKENIVDGIEVCKTRKGSTIRFRKA